jgi:hypothetical protein
MRTFLTAFTFILILAGCSNQSFTFKPFYKGHLNDWLNSQLNEAIIQDGFSPPVASRIYAYLNIGMYECYALADPKMKSLDGLLNQFRLKSPEIDESLYCPEYAAFETYIAIARHLVYRDFIVDTMYLRGINGFEQTLSEAALAYSKMVGDSISSQIIAYSRTDNYGKTRSYPLYNIQNTPHTWVPTPPMYGTAIEPFWGEIRPFVVSAVSEWLAPAPLPFDSNPKSDFYREAKEVYQFGIQLNDSLREIALRWDGDPMPPYRLKHINVIKRQLNPVGHWLGISSVIAADQKLSEKVHLQADLKISLSCADAMIVCWYNKFYYNLLRPHTYINRYIDEFWDPLLATPLFPEYPSGHSVLSGAASAAAIAEYGDVAFTDRTGVDFGFAERYFSSISAAAQECAESRIYGGVHYRSAVAEGVKLGTKLSSYHSMRIQLVEQDKKTAWFTIEPFSIL